ALAIFKAAEPGKAERIARLRAEGYPCYTTSAGWLGYSNEKLTRLATEAVESGFTHIKMKVGRDLDDDIRRLEIVRAIMGPDRY
ncbi:fuconate dehydratase, partial [Escherichia coli]|uniref:enolase C-terminal domain-like protein n=1 Tax=Escherichia coli TaxID=562 RepID=UPI0028DE5D7F|nr:fuconate dehydratase [Escherichia coli]